MFKVETGSKTVEHKTMTVQQRTIAWAVAVSFVGGFALNGWATSTANAADRNSNPTSATTNQVNSATTAPAPKG